MFTDKQMIDWIETHPENAPHKGMNGGWFVTANSGRECWGRGDTFRSCMTQVLSGTGPDKPDNDKGETVKEKRFFTNSKPLSHGPVVRVIWAGERDRREVVDYRELFGGNAYSSQCQYQNLLAWGTEISAAEAEKLIPGSSEYAPW